MLAPVNIFIVMQDSSEVSHSEKKDENTSKEKQQGELIILELFSFFI